MLAIASIKNIDEMGATGTDIFISACGYEGRSTAAARQLYQSTSKKLAIGFALQHELEYTNNREWFKSSGFEFIEADDETFRAVLDNYLAAHQPETSILSLEIDISCFNRFRLAHLIVALRSLRRKEVRATFHYSIAEYTPPCADTAPTVKMEPVIPELAGWTTRPDRPPAAIVGLGYEPNKAIGVVDHLEINNATWAYYPISPIPEYYTSVLNANQSLLEIIKADGRCQPYDLINPAQLFSEINSLVDKLKPHFNTVLIPFGPKLFALIALLVASSHDEVGVWRVSSGAREKAVDRQPSGHTVSVSVVFRVVS